MKRRAAWLAVVIALALPLWARAALDVDPAQPLTRRVTVQLIQTALDNGTSPATVFGDATQRASIEAGLDAIWAQAGIDVAVLPGVTRYNNTFAYQGNAGSGKRSTNDLSTIISNARNQGGILNSDALVIDLFFVNVVPGFSPLSESNAAGLARIAANGIAGFVGDNLLAFHNEDVIASVFAHEIGHNLGLNHTADGTANLMSPGGTSEQLSASQISTARQSSFARLLPAVLAGDYSRNGVVDAVDYTIWRDTLGRTGSGLAADGNGNNQIDSGDYTIWKTNFGDSGAGAATTAVQPVPEPSAVIYVAIAWAAIGGVRWR